MRVEIAKREDGSGVLRCTREDGSVTWQKQALHAPYFALHDLTHFAVESTLHFKRGFFGLINAGWEIDETTGKSSRGRLPLESLAVENLVGMLDRERASGVQWSLQDWHLFGGDAARALKAEDLAELRRRRAELFEKWEATPPGGVLELEF